jgi:molecular chaperone GrpE (heat shock protein)
MDEIEKTGQINQEDQADQANKKDQADPGVQADRVLDNIDINTLWLRHFEQMRQQEKELLQQVKENNPDGLKNHIKAFMNERNNLNSKELHKEKQEFESRKLETGKWLGIYKNLFDRLPSLVEAISGYNSAMKSEILSDLPEPVKKPLQNRKSGIEIIVRMLSRLSARQKNLDDCLYDFPVEITPANDVDMMVTGKIKTENIKTTEDIFSCIEDIGKRLQEEYDNIRNEIYEVIRNQRQGCEKVKKEVLGFLEQHFIPVVDGVDSGLQNTGPMKQALEEYPQHQEIIDLWFGMYPAIEKKCLAYLDSHSIKQAAVKKGDRFDENIHNAMSTTVCPEMENETIASVIRNGYTIDGISIRAADVEVAVKEG